jgi:hypothetical protein
LWINRTWVPPSQVHLSADKMVYTFDAKLDAQDGGGTLQGHINFASDPTPHGILVHNAASVFAIQLQSYATEYSFSVSANAGAVYSSGKHDLSWDVNSPAWKNATWENNAGIFAYDVASTSDPVLGDIDVIEVGITDNKSASPSVPPSYDCGLFMAQSPLGFTAVFAEEGESSNDFKLNVSDSTLIPSAPPGRSPSAVKSVFAQQSLLVFDATGSTFVGAYLDKNNNCYAIKGQALLPAVTTATQPFTTVPPVQGAFPTMSSANNPSLTITGLLNLNPMMQDSSGQWYDSVSRKAMSDFHDGILTFMDSDLHSTFVGGSPPPLEPEVRSILNSDPVKNPLFYKKLQVPYLVSALSGSTQPSAALLNGARAAKMLKDLPANDPVYKAQSTALYALRWKQMYPIMQLYLDDQQNHDYTAQIKAAGQYLQNDLASRIQGIPDPTGGQAKSLKQAQQEIAVLQDWAISHKLYWAFILMYYCQTHYLPLLQAKMASGTLSANVAMEIKTLGATFGILEGNAINPNGQSFQASFNDMIRAFNLTVILPQFVDAEGNSSDYNEIIDAIMQQFVASYSNDKTIQDEVATVTALLSDQQAIQNFINMLVVASRMTASMTSWSAMVSNMRVVAQDSNWYKKLANGAGKLGSFMRLMVVASVIMPLLTGGGWQSMTAKQRAWVVTDATQLFVTFTVKIAQGRI